MLQDSQGRTDSAVVGAVPRLMGSVSNEIRVLLVNPPYLRRHGSGVVPPMGLAFLGGVLEEKGCSVSILDLAADEDLGDGLAPGVVRDRIRDHLDALGRPPTLVGVGPLVSANLRQAK